MDPSGNIQMDVTDDDKLWALLCWILSPIVPIIILLLEDKKARPFLKYNAVQALAFSIAGYIISGILSPVFGIGCVVALAVLVYVVYLGIQSYGGKLVTVPVVTDFCKGQGWI
ncbi:MAG: DUF4870 domain-containing protein [Anaerolineae bacterium]|nr:DUF4870 domain-containing protein [Anaerolineae bacterium]